MTTEFRPRCLACLGLVLMILGMGPLAIHAEGMGRDLEYRFSWDQGNAIMASADSKADFLWASETYRALLIQGLCNGPLLYNYGTALLLAEKYEDAQHAFLRAERHLGTTPEIRRSLAVSASAGSGIPASLPWYRLPLFWHYGLPGTMRITIVAAAFSLFWIALALRTLGFRGSSQHTIILALLVLMLFGSSVAVTLHSEARDHDHLLSVEARPQATDGDKNGEAP